MCVLSEECRAGSAPPGEGDVMADSFLFSEPVEQADSSASRWVVSTCEPGFGSPISCVGSTPLLKKNPQKNIGSTFF